MRKSVRKELSASQIQTCREIQQKYASMRIARDPKDYVYCCWDVTQEENVFRLEVYPMSAAVPSAWLGEGISIEKAITLAAAKVNLQPT